MRPKLKDILFLDKECEHSREYENRVFSTKKRNNELDNFCPEVEVNQENLENLIKDELKGKYYPGFVKYFKSDCKDCMLKSVKNSQKSVEARIAGNALFAKEWHSVDAHHEIWKLYSKSIALAPSGSKELVLAYECRSNMLLHFKKYEDCIKDIDRALSITEFDLLKVKLLARKMTCFGALNKDIAEKKQLEKILKYHFEKVDVAFKNKKFLIMIERAKNTIPDKENNAIKKEQKCFTTLTSLSNMTFTQNKERRIIADRDFEPGEAVIVTKPTITSVNPNKFYAYCSYCLSFMWAGIPCDRCSLCMYCSEECKKEAWEKYHMLECKVNPHIDFPHPIYYKFSKSIKIFMMGVREFGSLLKLLEKVREVQQLQDDPKFMKGDKFADSEFLNFFTLRSINFTDVCILSNTVKKTCYLMAYLTQTVGNIFEKDVGNMKGKELTKDKDFVYSTYVMLKIMILCELYMQYPHCKESPFCPKYESREECTLNRCCPVGSIFYFFKGLLDYSCNPNVTTCKTEDGKIIYFCVQPIKKMEMITVAQFVSFYQIDRKERHFMQPDIQSIHDFCKCIACLKNWPPVLQEFKKFEAKFERRSGKLQTKGTELVDKYLHRKNIIDFHKFSEYKCSIVRNVNEFQEFARDTSTVISTCGQPSFASSWMILMLRHAFIYLYGDPLIQSQIPKDGYEA